MFESFPVIELEIPGLNVFQTPKGSYRQMRHDIATDATKPFPLHSSIRRAILEQFLSQMAVTSFAHCRATSFGVCPKATYKAEAQTKENIRDFTILTQRKSFNKESSFNIRSAYEKEFKRKIKSLL